MKRMCSVVLLVSFVFLNGCCTVVHGTHQNVPINSNPNGANVAVDCGEGVKDAGVTPVTVNLKRNAATCKVNLKKEGYEDASVVFAKSMSGWVWGNLLIGGIIGWIVDGVDGAVYNRVPDNATVSLTKK